MFPNRRHAQPDGTATFVVRRIFAATGVAAYLAAMAGFLVENILGDTALFPAAYFFTWDMFPSHNTRSMRRVAVGRTEGGKFVQLHPSPREQYRAGAERDFTRVDLEGRGFFYRTTV